MKTGLEKVLKERVKPIIDEATMKTLGITSPEIETDITDKLLKSPLVDISINISLPFKRAKHDFKMMYIQKLLRLNFGNISKVAKIAAIDRRSIHRMIKKFNVDVPRIRQEMLKAEYYKEARVADIIGRSIESYKGTFSDKKLKELAEYLPKLSREIVKELPEEPITLKEAEEEFEKRYLFEMLKENKGNIAKTARQIKLRYEVVHRKLKKLGLI